MKQGNTARHDNSTLCVNGRGHGTDGAWHGHGTLCVN